MQMWAALKNLNKFLKMTLKYVHTMTRPTWSHVLKGLEVSNPIYM